MNKYLRFKTKKQKKFYYAFKMITPIICSFLSNNTSRFRLHRDVEPLSARIGYDVGLTHSYEPYTENILDFKLEKIVRSSFSGLFSTYDILTFDYDWEIRQELVWDENDIYIGSEAVDADLYDFEPAIPVGITKNEVLLNENPLLKAIIHPGLNPLLKQKGNGLGHKKASYIIEKLKSKMEENLMKILKNVILFGETDGGTQGLYCYKFLEDKTMYSKKYNGRSDHWYKGKRARLFSYKMELLFTFIKIQK